MPVSGLGFLKHPGGSWSRGSFGNFLGHDPDVGAPWPTTPPASPPPYSAARAAEADDPDPWAWLPRGAT
eukprot:10822438-Alexandrium_andersonii.AAC.1